MQHLIWVYPVYSGPSVQIFRKKYGNIFSKYLDRMAYANNVDPDQIVPTVPKKQFDLDLHCIQFTKYFLTLKAQRKTASENVVCLCRLLNILADFSNLFLHRGK